MGMPDITKNSWLAAEDSDRRGPTNIHNFGTMTKKAFSRDATTLAAEIGAHKAELEDNLAVWWVCTGEGMLFPNGTGL